MTPVNLCLPTCEVPRAHRKMRATTIWGAKLCAGFARFAFRSAKPPALIAECLRLELACGSTKRQESVTMRPPRKRHGPSSVGSHDDREWCPPNKWGGPLWRHSAPLCSIAGTRTCAMYSNASPSTRSTASTSCFRGTLCWRSQSLITMRRRPSTC